MTMHVWSVGQTASKSAGQGSQGRQSGSRQAGRQDRKQLEVAHRSAAGLLCYCSA